MKKIYTKPEVFFESFSMSVNIAGECENGFTLPTGYGVCGIPDENDVETIFNLNAAGGSDCTVNGTGNEVHDGFCYHEPTLAWNLFNS